MSVCMSVSSVTLVHPAKTAGRNEMPFDRDIRVIPSNIVLDRVPGLPMGRFGVETPVRSNDAYRQITLAIVKYTLFIFKKVG